MSYQNISEIYASNDKVRAKLKNTVANLSEEQANFLPEGEKWTIANFVEHLSIVEDSMTRIIAKLLRAAEEKGEKADGTAKFSESFLQKTSVPLKLEAPERMRPTGAQTIAESLAKMDENRNKLNEMRPLLETIECAEFTFPHPALGEMTAHEWLVVLGGHEARHIKQIESIISQLK